MGIFKRKNKNIYKKKTDILSLFHQYTISIINTTADIDDELTREILTRENMVLLCDYVTDIIDKINKENDMVIFVGDDIRKEFREGWEKLCEKHNSRIANVIEQELTDDSPQYIS